MSIQRKLYLLNMQRDHFIPVVRSLYAVNGSSSLNALYVGSMVLLMFLVAYFLNVFGMFLSRLSLFSLLYIFSVVSGLSSTLYCVN